MHPVLFKIGDLTINTYGFFVAIGFIAGILLAKREAKRLGVDHDKIMDLIFYIIMAAIIGSRLFYVAINPRAFANPLEILKIWNGGLVFYGGFLVALITALIYLKKNNLPVWKTADIMAPSIAAGQFFGRLGCFSAGCCYGKACDFPWAVTFTNTDSLAPLGISIHPTQLYHAAGNLLIFCMLWFWRTRKKIDGHLFWSYVLLYGITRSFLELFRGDFRGNLFLGAISFSQIVGGIMTLLAVFMILYLKKVSRERLQITNACN